MTPLRPVLSVIVPVYYNQDSLLPLYEELVRLEETLGRSGMGMELVMVNDGSRDASHERLLEIKRRRPETVILRHVANRGSMAALKTGLARATGDCFTFLAADLQDPPDQLPEMVQAWRDGWRLVVRVRASRSDPWTTKAFAWVFYRLLERLVVKGFPPGGYDMAVMDRIMQPYLLRCGKNKNLSLFVWTLGFEPKIFTYHRQERQHGQSMWSFSKKLSYFVDSIIGFSIKPLRLASAAGILVAFASFLYVLWILFAKLTGLIQTPGFSTIVALLGFLHGIVLTVLGLIGEYIWRIYLEINNAPEAIAEEIQLDMAKAERPQP